MKVASEAAVTTEELSQVKVDLPVLPAYPRVDGRDKLVGPTPLSGRVPALLPPSETLLSARRAYLPFRRRVHSSAMCFLVVCAGSMCYARDHVCCLVRDRSEGTGDPNRREAAKCSRKKRRVSTRTPRYLIARLDETRVPATEMLAVSTFFRLDTSGVEFEPDQVQPLLNARYRLVTGRFHDGKVFCHL
ncbi:GL11093 [Drosophila persimilis]|uniref:GL11093 n=1 Tax=Drosophila persimilis TaxID=7234 RepID=B4GBX3_DROPE|nr:GL11093 [Drosophila persimilis]